MNLIRVNLRDRLSYEITLEMHKESSHKISEEAGTVIPEK